MDAPRPAPADWEAPKAVLHPQPAPTPRVVRPWQAPLPSRRPARRSSPTRAAARLEAAQLQRRVEVIGGSLQPSATCRPAAERIEALKQRLIARRERLKQEPLCVCVEFSLVQLHAPQCGSFVN